MDDVEDFDFETDAEIVEGIFLKRNTRKAIGPDNILYKDRHIADLFFFLVVNSLSGEHNVNGSNRMLEIRNTSTTTKSARCMDKCRNDVYKPPQCPLYG